VHEASLDLVLREYLAVESMTPIDLTPDTRKCVRRTGLTCAVDEQQRQIESARNEGGSVASEADSCSTELPVGACERGGFLSVVSNAALRRV
jgi:hypothetical protein